MFRLLNNIYGQIRGYDRWRIRRAVDRHMRMSAADLKAMSEQLFQKRVRAAMRLFPQYSEKVKAFAGRLPGLDDNIKVDDLPVWTRDDQGALFASLQASPIRNSFKHSTGGSTGVPVHFYVTRESYEWRNAVSDRGYSWAGAEEGRRSFYVWGSPVSRLSVVKRVKSHVHHCIQRRKYFDSFHFDDEQKKRCCRLINSSKPLSIVGYAGNLVELALFVRDHPEELSWKSQTIVTAAEGVMPGQREVIEEYLCKELFLSYGSREFMLIGMECGQHNGYHISSDNLYVEVIDEAGKQVKDGESGRILVTDLRNDANPFIRYEIGDIGTYTSRRCSCGLPFPLLVSVDGRGQEVIYRADGSTMTALFIPHLMKEFSWIDAYQLRQDRAGELNIGVITREKITSELEIPIRVALKSRVGEGTEINFNILDQLAKSQSGKVPIVISTVE